MKLTFLIFCCRLSGIFFGFLHDMLLCPILPHVLHGVLFRDSPRDGKRSLFFGRPEFRFSIDGGSTFCMSSGVSHDDVSFKGYTNSLYVFLRVVFQNQSLVHGKHVPIPKEIEIAMTWPQGNPDSCHFRQVQ